MKILLNLIRSKLIQNLDYIVKFPVAIEYISHCESVDKKTCPMLSPV